MQTKFKKILLIIFGIVLISAIGLLTYNYFTKPYAYGVQVTNPSSGSFTVTWTTNKPSYGTLIVKENNNWVPIADPLLNDKFYDDRDTEKNEDGEYIVSEEGRQKRRTHQVTVRGLKPSSEYNFQIIDGAFAIDSNVTTAQTYDAPTQLTTPDTAYGTVLTENPQDSVINYQVFSDRSAEKPISQIYSVTPNDTGGWATDISTLINQDGEYISLEKENSFIEIKVFIGDYSETAVFDLDEYKPLPNIVVNPNKERDSQESENLGYIDNKKINYLTPRLNLKTSAIPPLGDWYAKCQNTFENREPGGVAAYYHHQVEHLGKSLDEAVKIWAEESCANWGTTYACHDMVNGAECGGTSGGSSSGGGGGNQEIITGLWNVNKNPNPNRLEVCSRDVGGTWMGGSTRKCNTCIFHDGLYYNAHTSLPENSPNICESYSGNFDDPYGFIFDQEPPSSSTMQLRKAGQSFGSSETFTCTGNTASPNTKACGVNNDNFYTCSNSAWIEVEYDSDCTNPSSPPISTPAPTVAPPTSTPSPTVPPSNCTENDISNMLDSNNGYPVEGMKTKSYSSYTAGGYGYNSYHPGLDINSNAGNIITAFETGRIAGIADGSTTYPWDDENGDRRFPYWPEQGKQIHIEHRDGVSVYSHLNRIDVSPGDIVCRDQQIGIMGSTGIATGVHVHFELRTKGYLNPTGNNIYGRYIAGDPNVYIGNGNIASLPVYGSGSNTFYKDKLNINIIHDYKAQLHEEYNLGIPENSKIRTPTKLSPGVYLASSQNPNYDIPVRKIVVPEEFEDGVYIQPFLDENNNNVKDPNEQILEEDIIQLSINQESEVFSYDFDYGWNSIALPFVSEDFDTPEEFLDLLRSNGIMAVNISKLERDKFIPFVKRENGKVYEDEFKNIIPGDGFVVKVLTESGGEITFTGQEFTDPVPNQLENGWNLIGVNTANYTAEKYIDNCIAAGIACDTFSAFRDGLYSPLVVKEDDVLFGNDFPLLRKEGYFVRVKEGGGELFTSE